jgi:hypothetical protein
MVMGYGRR